MNYRLIFLFFSLICLNAAAKRVKMKYFSVNMQNTLMSADEFEYDTDAHIDREDLVVVSLKNQFSHDGKVVYRVVAIPGDIIEIKDNIIIVNGRKRYRSEMERHRYKLKIKREHYSAVVKEYSIEDISRISDSSFTASLTVSQFQRLSKDERVSASESKQSVKVKSSMGEYFTFSGGNYSHLKAISIPRKGQLLPKKYVLPLIGNPKKTQSGMINSNYYFLLSDDYWQMPDSRGFGLCPSDSIIGVVTKVIRSKGHKVTLPLVPGSR